MFKKSFDNNDDYRAFLNDMFEQSKRIGAAQEREKDYSDEYIEVDFEINLNKNGFQVYHDNKTFMCQTGKQLVDYLRSMGASNGQLLDMQELLLKECLKRGMKFPIDLIDG